MFAKASTNHKRLLLVLIKDNDRLMLIIRGCCKYSPRQMATNAKAKKRWFIVLANADGTKANANKEGLLLVLSHNHANRDRLWSLLSMANANIR